MTFAQDRGAVIIDVRPSPDFDNDHIKGSINVPFFQPIEGWSAWKVLRRAGFAFFGVFNGTEPNLEF